MIPKIFPSPIISRFCRIEFRIIGIRLTRHQHSSKKESEEATENKTEAQKGSEESTPKTPDASSSKEEDLWNEEPVDLNGKTESYWRKTMTDARQDVKKYEDEATALELKLNKLQDQFYKEDDGFRRETVQREIQKTYYEQDLNKENLAKARVTLQDLEKEAHKSGALPGWIEP